MSAPKSFDYAVIRIVPRVERGEFINVGVILHSRPARYLGCRLHVDEQRLLAFAPEVDIDAIKEHLRLYELICKGGPDAGPIGHLPAPERFHWLTSPRSTSMQVSDVHPGLCHDPQQALEELFQRFVILTA